MERFEREIKEFSDLKEFGREITPYYTKDKTNKHGIVYAVSFDDGVIKVGKTQDPENRLYNVAKASGRTPNRACAFITDKYSKVEFDVLNSLKEYNVNGEFFSCGIDLFMDNVVMYLSHVDTSEIERRNTECEERAREAITVFMNFKKGTPTFKDFDHRIAKNMTCSKIAMWGNITGGYGDIDFESLPDIFDSLIDIEKINNLMIDNKLFIDDYTPSQTSLDDGILRNVKISVSDICKSFKTYNATIVTSKGLDVIGEILLNEFR
jgi:hypothetical protein